MSNPNHFDCIVIGFGGVGSQALRHAAMKGWRVLGIDPHGPAHDKGSSHGQTRIFRTAYFEHPDYVPLLQRAHDMWDELNKRHRTSPEIKELFTASGVLMLGQSDSESMQGVRKSADEHDLTIEEFSHEQVMQRLPIFKLPDDFSGLYEPKAGFLRVELCVAAAIKQAIKAGAKINSGAKVLGWKDSTGSISVETTDGNFSADRLIIATGAWTKNLLPEVPLNLQIIRKQQHWFQLDRVEQKLANAFPAFAIATPDEQLFYSTPEIDHLGLKVCRHTDGTPLESADQLSQELDDEELDSVNQFMSQYMNFGRSRLVHHTNCMYTTTPDGHFIIDRHPNNERITFAAGLSGHGFKFAPVIGKYLVDLLDGEREAEFEFLRIR